MCCCTADFVVKDLNVCHYFPSKTILRHLILKIETILNLRKQMDLCNIEPGKGESFFMEGSSMTVSTLILSSILLSLDIRGKNWISVDRHLNKLGNNEYFAVCLKAARIVFFKSISPTV